VTTETGNEGQGHKLWPSCVSGDPSLRCRRCTAGLLSVSCRRWFRSHRKQSWPCLRYSVQQIHALSAYNVVGRLE